MRLSGVEVPRPASPFITHETIGYYQWGWRLLYLVAELKIGSLIALLGTLWFDMFINRI
jgi:hypothetical protein